MAKGPRQFRVPLMHAFRDAFAEHDAKKSLDLRERGERVLSQRASMRRAGTDEQLLKENLAIDLVSLVNTIDLASALDLDGLDQVKRSVLNFGLPDVSSHTSEEAAIREIALNLRAALAAHEPRLDPSSIMVDEHREFDDVEQRICFNISAEMYSHPYDVPIEFVAEVDVGSGKVLLSRLPIST